MVHLMSGPNVNIVVIAAQKLFTFTWKQKLTSLVILGKLLEKM